MEAFGASYPSLGPLIKRDREGREGTGEWGRWHRGCWRATGWLLDGKKGTHRAIAVEQG